MANIVEILIKANTTQATSGLKSFTGGLNQVVQGLTGFSISSLGVASAIVAVGNEIKKAVIEYSDYATAIGKAAELSGVGAEEMSRLAQAADDVFVSQEALTRGFQMALKNGFVPSIENLAKLSDELLAIKDPAERAEKASKIFGRQWAEIAPFILQGGDAIREGTDAIADGLIVTDEAVQQNLEYKKSLDEMNDSILALKMQLGGQLIPYLTAFVNALNNYDENQRLVNDALGTNLSLNPAIVLAYGMARQGAEDAARAVDAEAQSLRMMPDAIGSTTGAIQGLNIDLENTAGAASAGQAAMATYQGALGGIGQEIVDINDSIAKAQQDVTAAQEEWNNNVAGKTVNLLDESKLGTENYQAAIAAGDEIFGTSYLAQDKLNRALEDAAKKYQATGDLETYKKSLIDIKDQYQPLDEKIQTAKKSLLEFEEVAKRLDGMRIDLLINIQQEGGFTLPGGANAGVPVIGGGGGGGSVSPSPAPPPSTVGPLPYNPNSTVIIQAGSYSAVDASRLGAQIAGIIQGRK